VQRESAAPEKD